MRRHLSLFMVAFAALLSLAICQRPAVAATATLDYAVVTVAPYEIDEEIALTMTDSTSIWQSVTFHADRLGGNGPDPQTYTDCVGYGAGTFYYPSSTGWVVFTVGVTSGNYNLWAVATVQSGTFPNYTLYYPSTGGANASIP